MHEDAQPLRTTRPTAGISIASVIGPGPVANNMYADTGVPIIRVLGALAADGTCERRDGPRGRNDQPDWSACTFKDGSSVIVRASGWEVAATEERLRNLTGPRTERA